MPRGVTLRRAGRKSEEDQYVSGVRRRPGLLETWEGTGGLKGAGHR
jgi:hypothetical protein